MQHPPYLICVYASKFFGNAACYAHYRAVLHSLWHISTGGEDGDFLDVILQDLRSCRRIVNAFGGMLN